MATTTALSRFGRVLIVLAVSAAGACGALIGWAVADLQCSGDCEVQTGIGGLTGAVLAALGTAVICVLATQAMAEWKAQEGLRR